MKVCFGPRKIGKFFRDITTVAWLYEYLEASGHYTTIADIRFNKEMNTYNAWCTNDSMTGIEFDSFEEAENHILNNLCKLGYKLLGDHYKTLL